MADHTDAPTMTDGERQVIDEMLHSLTQGEAGRTETGETVDHAAFESTLAGARDTARDMIARYPDNEHARAFAARVSELESSSRKG